jgi:amino acid transporter
MTAVVFERAMGSHWIVSVILAAALLSLLKVFNGNFIASSRLLFAMGRRGLLDRRVAEIHPRNQTPAVAVVCIGLATAVCMFLGDAILVPISEVGSVASAAGWMAACAAYFRMRPAPRERMVAAVGVTVGLLMILMKVVPGIPGHFSGYEWLALGVWSALGLGLGWRQRMVRAAVIAK